MPAGTCARVTASGIVQGCEVFANRTGQTLGKPGTDGTFPVTCDCGTFCSWLDSHASSALDTPHHVTQRGNARQFILTTDAERLVYLDLLRHYCTLHRLSLVGSCLSG